MDNAELIALLTPARDALNAALAKLAPASPIPAPAPVGRKPENPVGTVPGLDYIYVEGELRQIPDFTKVKSKASGTATHPHLGLPRREDGFAFRFTGFVYAPADGEYAFYSASDDGSRLYIGNQVVVDNDAIQGTVEKSGKILLQKGWHAFTLDYFDFNGAQDLLVSWSSATQAKQPIPPSAFARVVAAKPATPPVVPGLTVKVS